MKRKNLSPLPARLRRLPLLFLLLSALLFVLPVGAEEETGESTELLPPAYWDFLSSLPSGILDSLPEDFSSDRVSDVAKGLSEISSPAALLSRITALISEILPSLFPSFFACLGILLLSSLLSSGEASLAGSRGSSAFSFLSSLVFLLSAASSAFSALGEARDYLSALGTLATASVPLIGSLFAIGGNVGAGIAVGNGLSVFLALSEEAVGNSVFPFFGVCFFLSLLRALCPGMNVGTLLSAIKKHYAFFLSFLMTALNALLAAETRLAAKSDSLAMKSARFAVGSLIPVVGSSLSEMLRSLAAGIGYLRSVCGLSGILFLVFLFLPVFLSLSLRRLSFSLCSSVAELLGCTVECRLLSDLASLWGYLLAAVALCSSVLLLSWILLASTASAY